MTRPPYSCSRPKSSASHAGDAASALRQLVAGEAWSACSGSRPWAVLEAATRGGRREREVLEAQVAEPYRPATARPGSDRDFERAELAHRSAARRPPGERHLAAADAQLLPVGREVERVAMPPPDVAAARIRELDLELVRRRRAAHAQRQRPRRRHRARNGLARHDEAATALEVVVESQRCLPAGPASAAERELRLSRSDGAPAGDVAEVVERARYLRVISAHLDLDVVARRRAGARATRPSESRRRRFGTGEVRDRTPAAARCTSAFGARARAGRRGSAPRPRDPPARCARPARRAPRGSTGSMHSDERRRRRPSRRSRTSRTAMPAPLE